MRRLAVLLILFAAAAPAAAQRPPDRRATPASAPRTFDSPAAPRSAAVTDVRYRLRFDAAHARARSIGVAMTFAVRGVEPVLLSVPVWTPGAYEVSDYARNVSAFSAVSSSRPLRWDKLDAGTWRIFPDGGREITVQFEARADSLDNAFNWAQGDFALINGTSVCLYPEGQSFEFASTVTVETEPSWRVLTGLAATGATSFTAPNYHELVDAPFFVGRFDLDSTLVAGRWMRLATYPVGSETPARREVLWSALRKAVPAQAAVFGGVPWTAYTVMQIADSSFAGGMSALEHQNSNVGIVGTAFLDEPFVAGVYAHEIFHAWNVKRLRPADLSPYRYGAAQHTPWLWVSEGITDYYADLSMVRGGAITAAQFRESTQGKIEHVMQLPPVALEDASLQAWLHMRDGTADIYYDKGSLAGLALDILIRDATGNAASLDDVLRDLYATTYQAGRGFTADDWWTAVARAARGATFAEFNARYVDGREAYPWSAWLPKAGWRLALDTLHEVRLGVVLGPDSAGLRITDVSSGSVAQDAGIRVRDVLVRVAGVPANDPDFFAKWRSRVGEHLGAPFAIEVRRDGAPLTLHGTARVTTQITPRLEDDPAASPRAIRLRDGILHGTVSR